MIEHAHELAFGGLESGIECAADALVPTQTADYDSRIAFEQGENRVEFGPLRTVVHDTPFPVRKGLLEHRECSLCQPLRL